MLRNIRLAHIFVIVACLKMSFASSISSAKRVDLTLCGPTSAIAVKDFVHVTCEELTLPNLYAGFEYVEIRTYDSSHPHDLLMVMILEKTFARKILGFDNSNNLYVYERKCQCVWKIDILKHTFKRWLDGVRYDYSLTVSNDNSVMVMRNIDDQPFLEIYYENATLVRRVSLPSDLEYPHYALQNPDGEFVVSHRLKEKIGLWISTLSNEGEILTQIRLREAVGFTDLQRVSHEFDLKVFALEPFSGNLRLIDLKTGHWNLTDLTITIDNGSDEMPGRRMIFSATDGKIFSRLEDIHVDERKVFLTFKTDDRDLLVNEDIDMNTFPFDVPNDTKVKAFSGGAYVLNWESRNWSLTDAKVITVNSSRDEKALRSILTSTDFDIFSNLFKNEGEKALLLLDKYDLDGTNNIKIQKYPFGIGCVLELRMLRFHSYTFMLDWEIGNWKSMYIKIFIANSPEDNSDKVLSCLSTDLGFFSLFAVDVTPQKVRFFFDADDNNLVVWEDVAGDTYLLDMKTQNGSKIGSIPPFDDRWLSYGSDENRFTLIGRDRKHVNILDLTI